MAIPALRSFDSIGNVNDSPYSRILKEIDEETRRPKGGDIEKKDDEEDEDEDAASSSDDSDSEVDDHTEANIESSHPEATLVSLEVVTEDYKDLAQIQKKQAWLRGGTDVSDTASIRSATKRKVRQPGLLEALFLPKTTAAAVKVATRSNASVRPHVRRRSTTDLSKPLIPSSLIGSTNSSPRPMTGSPPRKSHGKETRRLTVSLTPTKTASPTTAKVECITCLDDVPKHKSALLECKHRMCLSCLKRIFTLSTTDPQLMPPRCCTDTMIPLKHVDRLFDTSFKATWNHKYAEYTTKHRLYCPTKNCGEWIKPKYIVVDRATGRKKGTCKECKTKVCKKCGLKWHGGRDCDNDEATKRVIDLGREHGWQRCYNCRSMVQLSEGCNHMRCRCNAEFCMVCGGKWKTCDCPWFNLPPDLGVDGFLIPGGQDFPPLPLWQRIGDIPPPPPPPPLNFRDGRDMPPPPPPPLNFRDRRHIPLDSLNLGDMSRFANYERPRHRRRSTLSAEPLSPQEQEAADEELARRLQAQEIIDTGTGPIDDADAQLARRRASRRARRTVYAVTGDDAVYELGEDGEEYSFR
jgi:hypothetical protein